MLRTLYLTLISLAATFLLATGCGCAPPTIPPMALGESQILSINKQTPIAQSPPNIAPTLGSLPPLEGNAIDIDLTPIAPAPLAIPATLAAAADRIAADLLSLPELADSDEIARVSIGVFLPPATPPSQAPTLEYEFAQRLRVELNRAANGRAYFISEFLEEIEKERAKTKNAYRLQGHLSQAFPSADGPRQIILTMTRPQSNESLFQAHYQFHDRQ